MKTYCDFCRRELEGKREFIYQMESLNFVDDEALLEAIRNVPAYHGEPLRICGTCNDSVQKNNVELQHEADEFEAKIRDPKRYWGTLAFVIGVIYIFVSMLINP
jgi:hypothetical protein